MQGYKNNHSLISHARLRSPIFAPWTLVPIQRTVVVYLKMTNSQRLVVLFSLLVIAVCFLNSQRLVVCVCFLPIHSGHQVRWTYQPGSHRRKVTHCYIPSSVAVHYLKTELTYLSSQSPGVSIHHSTIIARVISLRLVLYYGAGRPGSSEVPRNPLTRWDVSSIPANGIFLKLKNKNKNAQRVENDQIVSTQNSTSRSTRERNGWILLARKTKARTAERRWMRNPVWPSSWVTPAGTSNELDVQNEWEKTHTLPCEHCRSINCCTAIP